MGNGAGWGKGGREQPYSVSPTSRNLWRGNTPANRQVCKYRRRHWHWGVGKRRRRHYVSDARRGGGLRINLDHGGIPSSAQK